MRNSRLLAVSAALAFLLGMSAPVQSDFPVNAETMVSPRLTVDLNANDGRVASYAHNAENWIIDGETSASKEIGGLTFTLSTETEGGTLYGSNNKKLQKQNGIYPRLTMDGVTINPYDVESGGVLKLEIMGLSAGTHSLKTWHSVSWQGSINSVP